MVTLKVHIIREINKTTNSVIIWGNVKFDKYFYLQATHQSKNMETKRGGMGEVD